MKKNRILCADHRDASMYDITVLNYLSGTVVWMNVISFLISHSWGFFFGPLGIVPRATTTIIIIIIIIIIIYSFRIFHISVS